MSEARDPLPGEVWSRGGIARTVLDVGARVAYEVSLSASHTGPSRLERHTCSLATWLRWAREGALCLRAAQGELFARRRA